jgi:hypothetical protein
MNEVDRREQAELSRRLLAGEVDYRFGLSESNPPRGESCKT